MMSAAPLIVALAGSPSRATASASRPTPPAPVKAILNSDGYVYVMPYRVEDARGVHRHEGPERLP